ncbi:MAG: cytochrome c oxidase assembly protein [Candidatus Sericytochromatia bacterium]|nr:cytochrome c oxidase assembly protein [Candidatus Sericytochromatia bacterium]
MDRQSPSTPDEDPTGISPAQPVSQDAETDARLSSRHRRLTMLVLAVVAVTGILPWVYAPLYRKVCGVLGIPTAREQNPAAVLARIAREGIGKERADEQTSLVNFMGVSGQLPIDIRPLERRMWVKTGDVAVVRYRLTNLTQRDLDYRAVHMVVPKEDSSFELIKCFCDEHRILKAGISEDLPLVFRLSKAVPGDAGLTINYTIFDYDPLKNKPPSLAPKVSSLSAS